VTVECGGRAEIGAEIPVVPAVVPAEGHHVAAGRRARDSDRDRHRFAAGATEADHVRPGVQLDQQFREPIECLASAWHPRLQPHDLVGSRSAVGAQG
jgi:hypothetical protein